MQVEPKRPAPSRYNSERLKDGMRGAVMLSIGKDQLYGAGKILTRDLREFRGYFLEGFVNNSVAREAAPAVDPKAAKAAIAVVNQNRLFRSGRIHTLSRGAKGA